MRRLLFTVFCAAGLALAVPVGAAAAPAKVIIDNTAARATGTIVSLDWSSFTIQTRGRRMSTLNALQHTAAAVTGGGYPYVDGGGRYFGTSDGGGGSPLNPHGGAGWLDAGAPDAASHTFQRYHLLASALQTSTVYGPTLTFSSDAGLLGDLELGDRVRVPYLQRERDPQRRDGRRSGSLWPGSAGGRFGAPHRRPDRRS